MSLELERESVKIKKAVSQDTAQTVALNDIIVPDANPDIDEILSIDGTIYNVKGEVLNGRLLVTGVIIYDILYINFMDDLPVRAINSKNEFSYDMDAAEIKQGMKPRVTCCIEHIESEIINSRKLSIKSIIGIEEKVIDELDGQLVFNIDGVENTEVLKEQCRIDDFIGINSCSCTVNDVVEIPQTQPDIYNLLKNNISILNRDIKLSENKVIVKGNINIFTLYTGKDEEHSIQIMEYETPFNQILDFPGINEDAVCDVNIDLIDSSFSPEEDDEGNKRLIKVYAELLITAQASKTRELEIVRDAFSLNYGLDIKRKNLSSESYFEKGSYLIPVKNTIGFQENDHTIEKVLNIIGKTSILNYNILEGKLQIEGLIRCNILYTTNDIKKPVSNKYVEIPFNHELNIESLEPHMKCEINIQSDHYGYNMISDREIELDYTADVEIGIYNTLTLSSIESIDVIPLEEDNVSRPGIILYFTQPQESIWDIAKRYRIKENDIIKANNIKDNYIAPGLQIIIPVNRDKGIKAV
jgi:hypothetical protein